MTILCDPDASAVQKLSLPDAGELRRADTVWEAARLLSSNPAELLVVVGPNVPLDEALRFAEALRPVRPAAGLVLVRAQVDVSTLTEALRAGVREVVQAGDQAALTAACRRSLEVSEGLLAGPLPEVAAPPAADGRVVTVFSAKGGCGKTTLAINLAVALAKDGRKVCLVDLDLAFGDVAISVQLNPARTIVNALPMAGHVDTTGAASLLTRYRPGLDMLLAPTTPGDAEKIPPALIRELLTVLRGMYEYVVVDTPAQFSEHVLIAMDASAHHVLLTTPDVPALKNLRVTLDTFDMLSYPADIRSVVLNRADAKVGLTADDVIRVVRSPIALHVPSSREVPVSINKGTPIVLDNPAHPVSQAIVRFARDRLQARGPAARPAEPAARRGAGRWGR
jgi:MinD-like ATPase involved in chromosome partitioning or flagellar assembly